MKRKLILRSDQRGSGTDHQGSLQLDEPTEGTYLLRNFSMTNRLYNVNDTNDQIPFTDAVGIWTATLTHGFHNETTLSANVKAAMDFMTSSTNTVTYGTSSGKFTLANDSGTFNLNFASTPTNTARKLLGFALTDYTSAGSIVAPNCADLLPIKHLHLRFGQDQDMDVHGKNYFRSSLALQDSATTFGVLLRHQDEPGYQQFVRFSRTKTLDYLFLDGDDNIVDLNGCSWTLLLEEI